MSLADDVKIELLVLSLKNTFEFYPYWCPFFFLSIQSLETVALR